MAGLKQPQKISSSDLFNKIIAAGGLHWVVDVRPEDDFNRVTNTLWVRKNKNTDRSTEPFARPFPHSLTVLHHSIIRLIRPAHSFARSLTHCQARGKCMIRCLIVTISCCFDPQCTIEASRSGRSDADSNGSPSPDVSSASSSSSSSSENAAEPERCIFSFG